MTRTAIPVLLERVLNRSLLTQATDAELLQRFVMDRHAEAFHELIQRHAAVVWSVCRRSCGNDTLAEDAFQATFIALARSAHKVRQPDRLAGWLYGVARRTANKMRAAQRTNLSPLPEQATHAPTPNEVVGEREFFAIVEEEVDRLPEKYRTAVLLCWFEDGTLDEAARRLGVSKNVLWGRLRQARTQLQQRLEKRGYGLAALFGVGLAFHTRVEATLVQRAVEAAVLAPTKKAMLLPFLAGLLLLGTTLGSVAWFVQERPTEPKDAKKEQPAPQEALPTGDGFPLPPDALQRFGNRQLRHPEWITVVARSPDGRWIATGGNRSTVVWDTKTLAAKFVRQTTLSYSSNNATLVFLPDSKSLMICGHDEPKPIQRAIGAPPPVDQYTHAEIWDITTNTLKFTIKGDYAYQNISWVTNDGKEIATHTVSGNERLLRFHDINTGKELRRIGGVPTQTGLWTSGDGRTLAYLANEQGGFYLVETATGKEIDKVPNVKTRSMTLSHDGRTVVYVVGRDVIVYDVATKKERFQFKHPHEHSDSPMLLSCDGNTLFFGSGDGHLYRWDLTKNQPIEGLGRHSLWTLTAMALSPDESILYTVGSDKVVQRWDLKTNKQLPLPDGYMTIVQMLPSNDGKSLFIGDHGGWIHRWDIARGQRVQSYLKEASGGVSALAQSPDGKLLAVGRVLQDVQLWDVATGEKRLEIPLVTENPDRYGGDQVQAVGFTPDSKTFFTTSPRSGITAWDVATGKQRWQNAAGPLLTVDPQGRWLIASAMYGNPVKPVQVLDMATGRELAGLAIPTDDAADAGKPVHSSYPPYVKSMALRPDGLRLLTAHADGTLREWNTETWKETRRLRTGQYGSMRVAYSPDGTLLAVAHANVVQLWDESLGKPILERRGHYSEITQVAFTKDGRQLLSNGDLAPVLWDISAVKGVSAVGNEEELYAQLTTDNAAQAYAVQAQMLRKPDTYATLFAQKIKPREWSVERKTFDGWITNLDSPRFAVREQANKALLEADSKVPLEWLRSAVKGASSEEVRTRLNRLIVEREKRPDRVGLQLNRIIRVLEVANTPATKALLEEWANTPGETTPTLRAKAALARLK